MGLYESAPGRATRDSRRVDAGWTLIEVLVTMLVLSIITAAILGTVMWARRQAHDAPNRTHQWNAMLDTQEQLLRDVGRGSRIELADAQHFVVYGQYEIRNDGTQAPRCIRREYVADTTAQTLSVTTTWLGGPKCETTGAEESRTEVLLEHYTGESTFAYTTADTHVKTTPVTDLASIATVRWNLVTHLPGLMNPQELASAQAWTGRATTWGTGTPDPRADATAPVLQLVTPVEGFDQPVLQWTDTSPAVTTGMAIWRASRVTGSADEGDLVLVATIPDPAAVTTWTDADLPRGTIASYVVAMSTTAGSGPMSNPVITGIRPVKAGTPTATGAATSIQVTWPATVGATSYDLYRDDVLIATGLTARTFTDGPGAHAWTGTGYGHDHKYRVVAVNTWEQVWTTGTRGTSLPLGKTASQTYQGRGARALSNASNAAYTAPPAPSLTAAATLAASNTVTWTPSTAWVGAGGTVATTRSRGWMLEAHETGDAYSSAFSGERAASSPSFTHSGRTKGDQTWYRARSCNASGCSPYSSAASVLQRPATPTCTVDDVTTRSAVVTVVPQASTYAHTGYDADGGTVASGYTLNWTGTSRVMTVDKLRHGTSQAFRVRVQNAGGWSDWGACPTVTTPSVQLSLSAAPSNIGSRAHETRTIVAKATSSNATVRTPSIARTSGNPAKTGEASGSMVACVAESTLLCTAADSWRADPLVDGLAYTVTGRATDGVNVTEKLATASTTAQTAPVITVSTRTTRRIAASFSSNGLASESSIALSGTGTTSGKSGSWDPLVDGKSYTVQATSSDGFNVTTGSLATSTPTLPRPGAATCVATLTDAVAPGALTVSGGDQVRLGTGGTVYSGPRSYASLSAGTYVGYARNTNSDGYNEYTSAWDACPAKTVTAPFTPSGWGTTAPGCPAIQVYISPTSPTTWQIRRSGPDTCDLRWVYTAAGVDFDHNAGDPVGESGTLSIAAHPNAYTRTSGTSLPMGPTWWG